MSALEQHECENDHRYGGEVEKPKSEKVTVHFLRLEHIQRNCQIAEPDTNDLRNLCEES